MRPLTALLVCLATTSCIDDLPEPTGGDPGDACDLPGESVTPGCLALDGEGPGCAPTSAACFRQGASDCSCDGTCGSAGCAAPDRACPSAVAAFADTCFTVGATPGNTACNPCGCAECMQVCDGLGPTFALRPMSSERLATWPLSLPDRGTLGIYVRARGRVGGLLIGVWGGNSEPFPMPTGTANPQTELGNYVVRDLQSWDSPQMAPDTLALGFSAMNDIVVEIDCVVPFLE